MLKNYFLGIISFIKHYPGILYSFALILLLPIFLYYNAYFTLNAFQRNIDSSLQSKAMIAENIMGSFFSDLLNDVPALQAKVDVIVKDNPEINNLFVVLEDKGGEFSVLASQDKNNVGTYIKDPSLVLSYSQNQSIATLVAKDGKRFWNVVKPIYDNSTGEKKGLVSIFLSLQETDDLMARAIFRSYLIVFLTVILTLFLTLQHTRLFGYVSLSSKLSEVDKMKNDFIRMTTHELRTPIVTIKGYLDILEEEIAEKFDSKQKESFGRVKISVKNLNDLIDDILDVSRIEQGSLEFSPEKVLVSQKIGETIKELAMKAEEKKIQLTSDIDPGDYYLSINPQRLRQILFNLIENSIKYTPSGSVKIKTRASLGAGKYVIEVRDTGVGISAEGQKKLFERFYRVKTEITSGIPGTGLGLWITKQLVEKSGGQIFVESMEGVGTKFTLMFPLAKNV